MSNMNTQNQSNFLISWNTRGNGEANQEVSFSLTAAPCNNLSFPQWLLTQCQTNDKFLTAISDAFILALKPACQRIAKDSLNRVMTADFNMVIDSLVNGTPARSKYLEQSEAEAIAEVLFKYWLSEGTNRIKTDAVKSTAKALLIGALTNKPPKGTNATILSKVRESWSARLIAASIEVPPALIPQTAPTIDESAF